MASLLPINQKFYQEFKKKPDLYGPFWIIVTLVVVLTISGNLARWLSISDKYKFSYNFEIFPIAMSVLFGICSGLPISIKLIVNFIGNKKSEIPLLHGIGIYCYSFSSFLVTSLLCGIIPISWV